MTRRVQAAIFNFNRRIDQRVGRGIMAGGLGLRLLVQYRRTGNLQTLDAAILALRDAVAATPSSDPNLSLCLTSLGTALTSRFDRTGNSADINDGVSAAQQAVNLAPLDHPNLAGYLGEPWILPSNPIRLDG